MEKTSRRRKHIGKHVKPTDENIMQLLMPSILGMLICMVCLAGATWAWFTATTTVSAPPVSAAYFGTAVTISPAPEDEVAEDEDVKTYSINQNTIYAVNLTATGNASIGGYCVVKVDGDIYYTEHMDLDDDLSFSVCSSDGEIEVIPYWGDPWGETSTQSRSGRMIIKENDLIGNGTVPSSDDEDSEAPENTGGAVNIGGGETGSNDNRAANNDNAGDQNTSQSEPPSSPPANEDKGDSSDNNSGSSSDPANTTPSTSDNTAGGSYDNSAASDFGSPSDGGGESSGDGSDSTGE